MGWVSGSTMSKALIRHLVMIGQAHTEAIYELYWRETEPRYNETEENWKYDARRALEFAAFDYFEEGLIRPIGRKDASFHVFLLDWSEKHPGITVDIPPTEEDLERLAILIPDEEYFAWLLDFMSTPSEGPPEISYITFELTEKAKNNPELLQPIDGWEL